MPLPHHPPFSVRPLTLPSCSCQQPWSHPWTLSTRPYLQDINRSCWFSCQNSSASISSSIGTRPALLVQDTSSAKPSLRKKKSDLFSGFIPASHCNPYDVWGDLLKWWPCHAIALLPTLHSLPTALRISEIAYRFSHASSPPTPVTSIQTSPLIAD